MPYPLNTVGGLDTDSTPVAQNDKLVEISDLPGEDALIISWRAECTFFDHS